MIFVKKVSFPAKTADGISMGYFEEIELNGVFQGLIRGRIHTQVATHNVNMTLESETPTPLL